MRIGQRFYALHMVEGLANYPEMNKVLLIREEAIRRMDPTMSGVPVVFNTSHLTKIESEQIARADRKGAYLEGIVNKSFFNENDGRHWCEIVVWDDNALAAIAQGTGVSNAYVINSKAPGGEYHAFAYDMEVMDGEYDHLLITANPRYEEAKILTPEQFEAYNKSRKEKLALVTNQKESTVGLFKRTPEEIDLSKLDYEMPKSKKTVNVQMILNKVDEDMKKEEDGEQMANMGHKVKIGNATMKLSDLMADYGKKCEENLKLKNENDEWKAAAGESAENANESEEDKKKREDKEKADNAKNESEKAEKEKAENEKKDAIRVKNEKLKAARSKDELIRVANSRGTGTSQYEQPVLRFKEDAVADGLEHYGKAD